MKTSNKIFFGAIATISIAFLLFIIAVRATAVPQETIEGNGQTTTVEHSIDSVEHVSIGSSFHINLKQGAPSLSITADENLQELIVIEKESNEIRFAEKEGFNIKSRKRAIIELSLPSVASIYIDGNTTIDADTIRTEKLKLHISGSGRIRMPILANYVDASISGHGELNLSGKTDSLDYNCSGSGDLKAIELETNSAAVQINGHGSVDVYPIESLEAKIFGSGDIRYKGEPVRIDRYVGGHGNIHQIKE